MAGPENGSKLRSRLAGGLVRAMSAHSPLSAVLAEEAGFDAIWASGFELSALYGLPDASLVSMAEHLSMTRAIAARSNLPVVADIDTGFGNAINAAFAVREYECAGAAAVVIEDKSFPKMTSLIEAGRQELVRIEEFQGKLEAACAARTSDLVIVGRTEALIAGLGREEALRRAAAYEEAGADLILVHSKARTPDEVLGFADAWEGKCPLVVIPTSYPDLTVDLACRNGKIGMLIYGNHALRAAVQGMRTAFASIVSEGSSLAVEANIASVEEIFRLQRMDELKEAERSFLR